MYVKYRHIYKHETEARSVLPFYSCGRREREDYEFILFKILFFWRGLFVLNPLMPCRTMSPDQAVPLKLRAFRVNDVAQLAVIVAHARLLHVEAVESWRERIPEVLHIALGVQSLPGARADVPLAGLEHKE